MSCATPLLCLRRSGFRISTDVEKDEWQPQLPMEYYERRFPVLSRSPEFSGIHFTDLGAIQLTKCVRIEHHWEGLLINDA
jgi:hypothetical protein